MITGEPLAWLVLLAALPGWVFTRRAERRAHRVSRSALDEFLGFLAVGLATTLIAVTAVAALSYLPAQPLDFRAVLAADDRPAYVGEHVLGLLAAALLIEAIAVGLAWAASALVYRAPNQLAPGATARSIVLGLRPKGTNPFVSIELTDGRVLQGYLRSFDVDPRSRPVEWCNSGSAS